MKKKAIHLLGIFMFLSLFYSCNYFHSKEKFTYQLIPVEIEGKWGYINEKGKLVINPQFKSAYLFSDGLALVASSDNKIGYIDKSGRYVINPVYRAGTNFSEGYAFVTPVNGFPTCIDKKGEIKFILKQAESVENFSEGLAVVCVNKKYGYVDKEGNIVISPQFDFADSFSEGLAVAGRYKGIDTYERSCGYIDKTGTFVISQQFEYAKNFSGGLAAVTDGKKYGYINKKGVYEINPQFEMADSFCEDLACVLIGNLCGYIDKTGKIVINPQFEVAHSFQNGLAAVRSGAENWGYINKQGKYEINPQFTLAGFFTKKFAPVLQHDKIGFIDKKGKYIINPQFSNTYNFDDYFAIFFNWEKFSSVRSDYYDINPFVQALLIKTGENDFNEFSSGMTLLQLIQKKKYENVKEMGKYAVEHDKTTELTKDISITNMIFTFANPIYKMVPQYYYGYYYDDKKEYQMQVKIASIEYRISIEEYGDASGKGELLAEGLAKELKQRYQLTDKSNRTEQFFLLEGKKMHFTIEYAENYIGFFVQFVNN